MAIEHEVIRLAKIVAADQNLKVHVRGVHAFATPGEVTLPSIDAYERLGKFASRMLHGLADHETGHSKYTDFDVIGGVRGDDERRDRTFRKYGFTPDEQEDFERLRGEALATLLNAVEDGWIEQKQGREFIGCRQNLHQKNRWWWEQDVKGAGSSVKSRIEACKEPFEAVALAITVVARKSVTPEEIGEASPSVYAALMSVMPILERVDSCDDTGTALRISMEIAKAFNMDEPPPEEEEPEPEDGEGEEGEDDSEDDEDSGPGTGDSEEGEDGSGGSSEPDDGEEDPEDGDGDDGGEGGSEEEDGTDDGSDDGEADSEPGSEGKGEGEPPPIDDEFKIDVSEWDHDPGGRPLTPEDSIAKVLHGVLDQSEYSRPYIVFSHEWDVEADLGARDLSKLSDTYETLVERARESVGRLASVFEAALQARREKRPVAGSDEGLVDPNLLAAFSMGAVPVDEMYLQYVSEDDTDVAVGILCDCSGSTGSSSRRNSVSSVLREAALAMSQAMTAAQVAHEVTGFTTLSDDVVEAHEWISEDPDLTMKVRANFSEMRRALIDAQNRGTDVRKFARAIYHHGGSGSLGEVDLLVPVHAIFKSFTSSDLRGLTRITGIHENLDGESLLWQAQRLAQRPEKRRVMFVLSDGIPHGSRSRHQGQVFLRETISRIVEAGIEVYGIGIKTDYVRNYYPHWWVVDDLEDLCKVAMTGLMDVLLRARQEHQWVDLSA